jgi:transposase
VDVTIQTRDKRQKNGAADAEAIVEAALRPSMRFVVEPKTGQQR